MCGHAHTCATLRNALRHRCPGAPTPNCTDAQMHRHRDIQAHRHTDGQMHRHRHADTHVNINKACVWQLVLALVSLLWTDMVAR
eukprot:10461914-Alexandrium_andersonii.AAC.1